MRKEVVLVLLFAFLIVTITSDLSAVQESSIVSYVSFNTTLPSGVVGYNLTEVLSGRVSKAVSLNGENSFVSVNNVLSAQQGTIEMWIKPSSYQISKFFYMGENTSGVSLQEVYLGLNNIYFEFSTGLYSYKIISNMTYSQKKWYHVIATYKNGTDGFVKLYVNGKLVGENSSSLNISSNKWSKPILLGKSSLDTDFFNGIIDEFKIYNIALTDSEVTSEYEYYSSIVETTCLDTDSSNILFEEEYYKLGTVNYSSGDQNILKSDECLNETTLREYYCYDDSFYFVDYLCTKGCNNSKCNGNISFSCSDKDLGINFSSASFVEFKAIDLKTLTYYDYCLDDQNQTIVEYFCSGNLLNKTTKSCGEGFKCMSGACVKSSTKVVNDTTPAVCSSGEEKCQGNLQVVCINGKWSNPERIPGKCEGEIPTEQEDCPSSQVLCADGLCKDECEKKSNSGLILILIFLCLLVIGAIVFVYFYFIKGETKTNNKLVNSLVKKTSLTTSQKQITQNQLPQYTPRPIQPLFNRPGQMPPPARPTQVQQPARNFQQRRPIPIQQPKNPRTVLQRPYSKQTSKQLTPSNKRITKK